MRIGIGNGNGTLRPRARFVMRIAVMVLYCALIFPAAGLAGDGRSTAGGDSSHAGSAVIGAAGALKEGFAQIVGARFLDVDGNIRRLGDENGAGPVALVFVDRECPVSARYLGEMNGFAEAAQAAAEAHVAQLEARLRAAGIDPA